MLDSKTHQLVLASASPRRKELLERTGIPFLVCAADIDEMRRDDECVESYVERMAIEKAHAALQRYPKVDGQALYFLGGDTVVALDGEVFGKPTDEAQALNMLRKLSGREHQVFTGVALIHSAAQETKILRKVVMTRVRFRNLKEVELQAYWQSGEPVDKAGAYAIQGLAAAFVDSIQGSYTAVVGMPLSQVVSMLDEAGFLEFVENK